MALLHLKVSDSKATVQAGWPDVPHIPQQTQKEMLASTPPYMRDARSKGSPSMGSGAIWPVEESFVKVKPFKIPEHWPCAYGLDVGWNKTACVWGARDPLANVTYLYTWHYRGEAEPSTHAAAIRSRGEWIPGVIDPAAQGRSQVDGTQLILSYRQLGLRLMPASNAVQAGHDLVWQMLEGGQLKVFENMDDWWGEYRIYRRDKNGKVIKKKDHLMDATRYLCVSGIQLMTVEPTRFTKSLNSTAVDADVGY